VGLLKLTNCGPPFPPGLADTIANTTYTEQHRRSGARFYPDVATADVSISYINPQNPTAAKATLYVWVAITVGWRPPIRHDRAGYFQGGVPMGYYNMAQGGISRISGSGRELRDNRQLSSAGDGRYRPECGNSYHGDVYFLHRRERKCSNAGLPDLIEDPIEVRHQQFLQ